MEAVIGRNNIALAYNGKLMSPNLGPNWVPVTFNGFQSLSGQPFLGQHVWNFNGNTYYSYKEDQYILEPSTRTWIPKVWNGAEYLYNYVHSIWINEFTGAPVYTVSDTQMKSKTLDIATDTWEDVTWSGFDEPSLFAGNYVWKCKLSDGTVETYISYRSSSEAFPSYTYKQIAAYTWQKVDLGKEYDGFNFWYPHDWDETKITYYSSYEDNRQEYVLNGEFHDITWIAPMNLPSTMWHTANNDYCSPLFPNTYPSMVRVKGSNRWVIKEWTGCKPESLNIWTDGVHIYHSNSSVSHMLVHEH